MQRKEQLVNDRDATPRAATLFSSEVLVKGPHRCGLLSQRIRRSDDYVVCRRDESHPPTIAHGAISASAATCDQTAPR